MGARCMRSADHTVLDDGRDAAQDPKGERVQVATGGQQPARFLQESALQVPSSFLLGDIVRRNRLAVSLTLRDTVAEESLPVVIHRAVTKAAELQIHNATAQPLAFKMKTTNPDTYKVKPVHGILAARNTTEVSIFLEPRVRNILVVDPKRQKPGKLQVCHCAVPEDFVDDAKSPEDASAEIWKSVPPENSRFVKIPAKFEFPIPEDGIEGEGNFVVKMSEVDSDYNPRVLSIAVDRNKQHVQGVVQMFNDFEKPAIFRIKTTSPNMYLVRPSQGIIQAQETMFVVITAQRSWLDTLMEENLDDASLPDGGKFLVQSAIVSSSQHTDLRSTPNKDTFVRRLSDVWESVESAKKVVKFSAAFRIKDIISTAQRETAEKAFLPSTSRKWHAADVDANNAERFEMRVVIEGDRWGQVVDVSERLLFHINGKGSVALLLIENLSESTIMFKTKTTNPDRYVVKPSIDLIECKSVREVEVLLLEQQVLGKESGAGKFLIQGAPVTREQTDSIMRERDAGRSAVVAMMTDIWNSVHPQKVTALKIQAEFR